jgi:hypothetical protein
MLEGLFHEVEEDVVRNFLTYVIAALCIYWFIPRRQKEMTAKVYAQN